MKRIRISLLFLLCGLTFHLGAATLVYRQDFTEDRSRDFHKQPDSLRFSPQQSHTGTKNGAMIFGEPGDKWVSASIRLPARPGQIYEIVSRSAMKGNGSNQPDHRVNLLDENGKTLVSSGDRDHGDLQILLPAEGEAPAGTRWIEVSWLIRGEIAPSSNRHLEIYQLEITELGPEGPRPFRQRGPYIDRIQGYVGEVVSVDMTGCFSRTVTGYTNDAGIPMRRKGTVLYFRPNETRPLHPPLRITALNPAGSSVDTLPVYLKVNPTPEPLTARNPDEIQWHNLKAQVLEPGQMMFPVNADHLFKEGLPPYNDRILSKPDWVEMPVDGLLGGHCPRNASPLQTEIIIERTDARGATARYSLPLEVIPPRSRVPTHFPKTGLELNKALKLGGNVVQLQPDTVYSNMGNMYGQGGTTTSARNPVIVLGAPGAVISALSFNKGGHTLFENVDFVLSGQDAAIKAKKTQGLRFRNCRFQGATVPVDLDDGTDWVKKETFRYDGNAVMIREGSFLVMEHCQLSQFNTAFSTGVRAGGLGVYRCTVTEVADDHCFFAESGGIWLEEVHFLGHGGNHTRGEHRDIIQLANPNQPPIRKMLIRRVFGFGDGQSQSLFIENEDQRIHKSRIPYGTGNHQDLLVEHSVFIGNSAHGISIRGASNFIIRNCLTLGHPDENYRGQETTPAYGTLYIRQYNSNGLIENCIADKLSLEAESETGQTNIQFKENLYLDELEGGFEQNRQILFPSLHDRSKTMWERMRLSPNWASSHPNTGPDILRP